MVTALPVGTATVSKLYISDTEVAKNNGENWAVSGGTVTLKKAYIATLEAGDTVFSLTFSAGNNANFTVTVTDTTPGG